MTPQARAVLNAMRSADRSVLTTEDLSSRTGLPTGVVQQALDEMVDSLVYKVYAPHRGYMLTLRGSDRGS